MSVQAVRLVNASSGTVAEPLSSVEKVCRILRVMSDARNTRLTDVALAAGLDKATTLRLLDALTREGFVRRDAETKTYSLGAQLLLLGAAASSRFDPRPLTQPSLRRLADTFEDTAILSLRSDMESLCLDLEQGAFHQGANYLAIGSRRPLGVGAASLALLAGLPDDECRATIDAVEPRLSRYGRVTREVLEREVRLSRERGYTVLLDVVVQGFGGIAMPILDGAGRPIAALSVAALSGRITSRTAALAHALKREVAVCQVLWSEAVSGRGTAAARSRRPAPRP